MDWSTHVPHHNVVSFLCYSLNCKTCIIVGNGGILANKSLGQKIDEIDVVVRYVLTHKYYTDDKS